MKYIWKEFKVTYSNKSFVVLYIFVIILFTVTGYSLGFLYKATKNSFMPLYFSTIYSFVLLYFFLNLYPIGENIREQISGGLENLLATPLELNRIIFSKSLVVFIALYTPTLLFQISIFLWSKDLITFLFSIFFTHPLYLWGISNIYVSTLISTANPMGALTKGLRVSTFLIYLFSIGPFFLKLEFPQLLLLILTLLISLIVLIYSINFKKKLNVERIVRSIMW